MEISIGNLDVGPVAIICPSIGKACGIARYSGYVADSLRKLGVQCDLMAKSEFLNADGAPHYKTILVQHEYGLFDYLSPLSSGETTAALITSIEGYIERSRDTRAAIIMHTIVMEDHVLNILNMQIFNSSIPVFHLNSHGCFELGIPYLEHGIYQYSDLAAGPPPTADMTAGAELPRIVASFGLLSPNKRPSQLIDICSRASADFIGNFATRDKYLVNDLKQHARRLGVEATIFSDFCEEDVLLKRLGPATIAGVAQEPIPHSATSGSVRFLMNLGIPVLASCVPQFEDCGDALIYCHEDLMHEMIQNLTSDQDLWNSAVERVHGFVKRNEMSLVYEKLLNSLHSTLVREFTAYRKLNFRETGHRMTLPDVLIRTTKTKAPSSAFDLIAQLSNPDQSQTAILLDAIPETGPVDFKLSVDRLISSQIEPADHLVFATSVENLAENLVRINEHLSTNAAIDQRARADLQRAIAKAIGMGAELMKRRDMVNRISESVLRILNPEAYKDAATIRLTLNDLNIVFSNSRGFSSRTRFTASAPILIALPGCHLISYLYRVAGLTAEEILSLFAVAGPPNDNLDDRVAWVHTVARNYPKRENVGLSMRRPDPRDFRCRTHFFRTELACLTNDEFSLAVEQIFFHSSQSKYYRSVWDNNNASDRRILLDQMKIVATDIDVVVIGLDEMNADLIDNIVYLDMLAMMDNGAGEIMAPMDFSYSNITTIARSRMFVTTGSNDLFVTPLIEQPQDEILFHVPEKFVAELSHIRRSSTANRPLRDQLDTIVFGFHGSGEEIDDAFWTSPFDYAESMGLSLGISPEPWAAAGSRKETQDATSSVLKQKVQLLPDQFWKDAWEAVEQTPRGRAAVPVEMSKASSRALPISIVTSTLTIDFIVIHKGQMEKYSGLLSSLGEAQWQVYFTNEVFVILSRRRIPALDVKIEHVPKSLIHFHNEQHGPSDAAEVAVAESPTA